MHCLLCRHIPALERGHSCWCLQQLWGRHLPDGRSHGDQWVLHCLQRWNLPDRGWPDVQRLSQLCSRDVLWNNVSDSLPVLCSRDILWNPWYNVSDSMPVLCRWDILWNPWSELRHELSVLCSRDILWNHRSDLGYQLSDVRSGNLLCSNGSHDQCYMRCLLTGIFLQ